MARQNIDEEWKTDPRRTALAKKLGSTRLADGMRVEVNWMLLDHRGQPIPLKKFKFVDDYSAWIECGLADVHDDHVYVAGASRYSEFFDKQKKNASKPKKTKRSQTKPKEAKVTLNEPTKPSISISSSISSSDSGSSSSRVADPSSEPPEPNLNQRIWRSYSDSFFDRYGTEPVRDKIVNSQIKKLGERLGEEAPDVARFYVRHNKAFYVSNAHKVGLLLSDAEALRTQWATGRTITQTQAQQADSTATISDQLRRIREGKL